MFCNVQTLEGHTNSVLRVDFMSQGKQLVSTGSDGLVKIWNLREEECIKTLDGHVDKVITVLNRRNSAIFAHRMKRWYRSGRWLCPKIRERSCLEAQTAF
jgi:WD40 repeat protein